MCYDHHSLCMLLLVGYQMSGSRGDEEEWQPDTQKSYMLLPTNTRQETEVSVTKGRGKYDETEHYLSNFIRKISIEIQRRDLTYKFRA